MKAWIRLALASVAGWAGAVSMAAGDSAPSPVQAPATTVAPVTARAAPLNTKSVTDDKVLCHTQIPIGSRLGGQKICMKKSDWEAQAADARRQRDFAPPAGIAGQH